MNLAGESLRAERISLHMVTYSPGRGARIPVSAWTTAPTPGRANRFQPTCRDSCVSGKKLTQGPSPGRQTATIVEMGGSSTRALVGRKATRARPREAVGLLPLSPSAPGSNIIDEDNRAGSRYRQQPRLHKVKE